MKLYKSTEGYEYTEDEVLTAAGESNMSIDDYIVEFDMTPVEEGEPGKKQPVAKKGAVATGKKKGTASKPATTSSASKKVNLWETPEQTKKRETTFGVGAIVKTPKQTKPTVVKQEAIVPQVDPLDEEIDLSGFKPEDFYTPDQIQKDPTVLIKFNTKLTNTKNKFDHVKEAVKAQKAGMPIKSLPVVQLIGLTPEETKAKTNDYAAKINLEMADETDPLNEGNYDPKATLANQSVDYKKKAQDVINAAGDYAWMKNYSKDDRVEYVQNNLAAPRLAYKVWNSDKNDFDIVAKKGYVNELKKLLPKNFAEIKDAKQLNMAIDAAITQYAAKDPSLQFQKELAIDKAKPLLSDKVKELQRKYNTATPEGLAKAEAEYNAFATKLITDNLNSSSAARDLEADFNAVAQTAATEVNTAFERSKDTFLSTMDKMATKGANPLLSMALEGMWKGVYGMGLSARQTAISSMHGTVSELNTFSKKVLEGHSDNEKYDKADEWFKMTMLEGFANKSSKHMDPPKTYGEAKRRIKFIVDNVNIAVEEEVDKIVKGGKYLELFKKADLKNGVQFADIVSLVSENVPNMVISGAGMATGNPLLIGLAAASAFTQEYGNQYYDAIITGLKRDLNREPTNKEIAEAINNGKYADRAEAAAWAAVSAGLEFVSELNVVKKTAKAMGFGTNANKALGSLMRGEIKAFGKSMYQQGKDFTSSGLGEFLTEGIQTGLGQASRGTQLNEGITKYLDVNQMFEDAQAGGIVGTVLPFGGSVGRQTFMELRNSARQVATTFDLSGPFGNFKQANLFFNAAEENINNRFEAGEITDKEKNAELESLRNIRNTGLKLPSDFTKEGKQAAFDLLIEKNKLETEIQGKDDALVAPQKERLKEINGELTAISIVEAQKKQDTKNMTALERNISAIEGYANTLGQTEFENAVGEGKGVESFDTVADFKAALESTGSFTESEINDAMESDGFMLKNGQIVINKQIAAQRNLHTMGHELLHKILKSEFSDPVRGKELKDKFLAQLSPEERKLLDERILAVDENAVVEELRKELGREPNETEIRQAISEGKGRLYSDKYLEEAPDEYLTQYFQIIADKKIPWSEKLKDSLENLWKNFLGLFFEEKGYDKLKFADGEDIYKFINEYAKSIKSGKISKRAQDLITEGKNVIKKVDAPSKSNLQGLLTDKYGNNKRRFISEGLMTTPSGKETFDFTKSVIGEELGGLVETITRRLYDGIPADSKKTVSREDYKNALISAAATLIDREWDPSKQDLDKFVSNRLNLRANSLAKELGIEGITEGGIKADVEQAKGLIAEEAKQEVKEKPKYKTILESKVFDDNVINSIKDKLIRELRTLKSRLDEPVSINKTVTPLVAEIKEAIGKQADIDIKKALGGKPNGEFRKNILKNKKAILENMTTTWLMGKDTKKGVEGGIPAAIQKQVDGKWLSYPDWVGKKIDREKVTTNLAGKTSGADMVRRLPNAANNISDADFLSFFLEPNGDLIRGRKESLSKAMAEELSFDIFKQGLEEGGPIADAFEKNQELKDVVLLDNYVNEVARQLDRGTVKFSKTTIKIGNREISIPKEYRDSATAHFRFVNGVNSLVNEIRNESIENVFDFETNSLLPPYSNKYDNFIGEFVAALYENGKIEDKAGIQFKQAIYKNETIPAEIRKAFKKVGNIRNNKEALDELNATANEIVKALDPAILKAIGYEWLGYVYRVMNPTKESSDGTSGDYYESLKNLKEIKGTGTLPKGLNIEDIRIMNKSFPLFKKIQKILDEDISAEEKLEKLKPLQAEIEAANIANIKLAVHLGTVIGNLLKEGKISAVAALNLAQIQTSIVAGWRGLSRLDLITIKNLSQKQIKGDDSRTSKGEHLAPNSNTMQDMVTVWFKAAKDNSINIEAELNKVFSEHSQWLTDVATTKAVDKAGGPNNDTNFFRVKFAPKEDQAQVYGIDGRTYMQVLADNEARKAANEAFGEFKAVIEPEIQKEKVFDKAMANAAKFSKTPKKIRVFDFDDTLARTKSNVLYTMPGDPKQYKIDAATFAKEGKFLEDAGAKWDFSEFSKVMNGKKGPLFEVAKIIADKRGTNDVFVLTARPANSAGPIHEFLKSLGLDIPVKNITGLGNSSPQAKADWIVGKAAEGYNDFYFADDHTGNVKAVKDALSVLDVKGRVQQAKVENELFSPEQITALQKEIESNYNGKVKFGNENNDIRTSLFNYDDPIAQKTSNGVDLRITEGLIRNQKKTYLLYADGKPVAEFKSVDDAKNTVKFIEDNLIKPKEIQKTKPVDNNQTIKFSLSSKRDLKWKQSAEDLSTNFTVGNTNYRMSLIESAYPEYSSKIQKILNNLADQNNLDFDKTIHSYDGDGYNLEFWDKQKGNGITGKGNAAEVFGIVINGTIDIINKKNIKSIIFTAKEPSRIKLYNAISAVMGKKLGWQVYSEDGVYIMADPSVIKKQSESQIKNSNELTTPWKEGYYALSNSIIIDDKKYMIELSHNGEDFDDLEKKAKKLANENNLDIKNILSDFDENTTKLDFWRIGGGPFSENPTSEMVNTLANKLLQAINSNNIENIVSKPKTSEQSELTNKVMEIISEKLGWHVFEGHGLNFVSKFPSGSNIKFSKSISQRFNDIIEANKGIASEKRYSGITSKRLGVNKGKYKFFLPPGAEDFEGLLYNFLGKGKEGEEQAKFFEETLLDPYWKGVSAIESARQRIKRDFKALKKAFPDAADKITKRTPDGNFTYDQAIRVYLWTKEGKAIPELAKGDQARLNSLIANDPQLSAFANGLELVSGRTGGWSDPSEFWDTETIVSELNDMTEKVGRKTFLEEFIKNADEIFSKENMNKIEAIYGTNIREALEDSLYRMKNGKNRSFGSGKFTNAVNNWVNGSVAEIMFLNTKSGILQLISSLNYLNWHDNNPVMAGKALLNFPQFSKDFAKIFNSDMMKERRQGLKEDVSAAEIANAAATAKNKIKAMVAYLAKIGFTPTTIADALAIGVGGATFYRNRVNTYEKQGMSTAEAEAKAWNDFTRLTNKSAQSNDPALISQQQAEPIGRIILAFGNATMQMNRIMKKSARDLINGRGNPADHVSKILFYGFIQNAIFSALQKALFVGLFGGDDDEEDKKKKKKKTTKEKTFEMADDMLDSFLRGSGLAGAVVSTAKNTVQQYIKQRDKKQKGDQAYTILEGLNISPSIGSKARKLYGAIKEEQYNREVIKRMGGQMMLEGRFNPSPIYNVGAKALSATTNLPADRLLDKITNISEALDERNQNWQRAMLLLGYKPFEIGVKNEEQEAIKAQAKTEKEDETFIQGIEKRKAKIKRLRSMTPAERKAYSDSIRATVPAKIERAKRRRKLLYGK